MRCLTQAQKEILNDWYEQNKENIEVGVAHFDLTKCDYFSYELLDLLEKINEFETIVQEVNRYISEKGMKAI